MAYTITAWQDRFRTPDPATLRKTVDPESVESFDRVRSFLRGVDDVSETLGWHGPTYCWCFEYHLAGRDEPLAILIPSPIDLQLAMPIDTAFLDQLPIRRMKRAIRDGLDLASPPFDTTWAIWSLAPGSMLEDLEDLVGRRVRYIDETADN